uniref:Truncated inclusion membrane protein A n=1 Tax=Chlamydia trachomatis TaxID=813 RepID=B2D1N5_CHLTH|nr:truncated inclusion membrane protein A [Chlamydia trachomatis]
MTTPTLIVTPPSPPCTFLLSQSRTSTFFDGQN